MPYKFVAYNFQDAGRAGASHEAMAALEAEGWTIFAASPAFVEMSCLWVKARGDDTQAQDDGKAHVDWVMDPEDCRQLFGLLRQHADVPVVASLIAEGAIPAEEPVPAE
jgi:hypothetical protein